ncbi:MAG: hypothetical protein K1X82_13090 [Bacteroidia bacterium]|nr:hypothetical protein [Bacteroidia bacterium]
MKLKVLIGFACIVSLFAGCKTDLDILSDYKAIPVIYSAINPSDSVHYVRIQKAFLGKGDAYIFSQIPDSNYFKDIVVKLIPYKINETTGEYIYKNPKEIILTETYVDSKESGVFFGGQQKLYATTQTIDPDYNLMLEVHNNENGEIYTSQTPLIKQINISNPNANPTSTAVFATQLGTYATYKVAWNIGDNGYVSELNVVFKYRAVYENSLGVTDTLPSQVTWKQAAINRSEFNNKSDVYIVLPGESFYKFLQNAIPNPGDTLVRIFDGIDFVVDVGTNDFYNFLNLNQQTTTIVQDKAVYSNIEGGYGIFTSRLRAVREGKLLNSPSTKELTDGQYTSQLKFRWP